MSELQDSAAGRTLDHALRFRTGENGLIFVDIENEQATATVCLQGAHVTAWQPRTEPLPVIWLSSDARFAPGKSIRGGIPLCWPWFGPHPTSTGLPSHGFARTVGWQVGACARLPDGSTQIFFNLSDSDLTHLWWPHPFAVQLRLCVGSQLRVELATTNTGESAFELSEALHTYFQIGDIGQAHVFGLDGTQFVDKTNAERRSRQSGPISFASEVDRVHLNTGGACSIVDPVLRRRIVIRQAGARSVVVWNPWLEKAAKMGDLGAGSRNQGGWREMVCVESGNALDDRVTVAPGATHEMSAHYSVEALA